MRKLHTGVMPPPNVPQPSEADRLAMLTWLETSLDAASAAKPNPGRTETLRRLNRTEYQNAIRDLLALDIDAASLLPADESGHGFDNVNVGDLSPTLLNRYISAAQKISRLAVGSTQSSLQSDTIQPACRSHAGRSVARAADWHARRHVDVLYVCPGRRVRDPDLARCAIWPESSAGCARTVRTRCWCCSTGSRSQTFTVQKPANGDDTLLDKDLKARIAVQAGPHNLARHIRQGGLIAYRHAQAADGIPLQRPAASAYGARHRPGFGDRTLCAQRRRGHTEPPPIVCLPANRTRQSTGRKVRRNDSIDADAARLSPADRQSRR